MRRLPGAEVRFVAAAPSPTLERVVEQGKVMTPAGVSSGIDMALRLAAIGRPILS
jgi:transcriptional regulator GlxA family with amidase domain